MRNSLQIAGILFGTALCSLADAQSSGYVVNHWVCEMATEQKIARSVPIGCEFVGALGCAANSPLSLHLDFQAPPGSTARLQLTNVPAGLQPAVGAQVGTVKRVNASTIEITPGLGTLSGFVSDATQSPVASVTINVPQSAVQVTPNPWLSGPASATQVRLNLKQVVGNYIADQTSISHFYYPCNKKEAVDRIKLNGLESTGAVALIDARVVPGGVNPGQPCVSYAGYTGVPFIALPNLFPKVSCLERVTVYSNGNALAFRKASSDVLGDNLGPFWTADAGQELPVQMGAMTQQPIKMWVLHDRANMAQVATQNLQTATRILRQQFGGIAFRFGGLEPSPDERDPDNSDLYEAIAASSIWCEKLDLLTQLPGVDGQHLNIFYLDVIDGYGVWCGDQPGMRRNIILMGANAKTRTLAHEIGHALLDSGRHADEGVDGFTDAHVENLMTYNAGGEQLTLGQLFRASLSPGSTVNRHGARSGPQATCSADSTSPDSCPALTRDVTPR